MGNIVLLDDLTINQIAAGEVIERPANVVKELVENSIDAGSDSIEIEIKNGGKTYIRVSDNGKGIARDDIGVALERHATSKIRKVEDLEKTYTMGFRGEALASISSISRFTIITKTKDDELALKAYAENGEIVSAEELPQKTGTTVVVEELFYNTPVRYKFLKQDFTEFRYIRELVEKIALANLNIKFRLINNGKTVFYTKGNGNIRDIVYLLYGKEEKDNLVDVDYTDGTVHITGVIGNSYLARDNRKCQIVFLNKRHINSPILTSSSDQAFKGAIGIGKFGFYILNIEIPASYYDVNVHPTKHEVRFKDEDYIFKALYSAIKKGILSKEFLGNTESSKKEDMYVDNEFNFLTNYYDSKNDKKDFATDGELRIRENARKIDYKFLGISFKTYIIIEIGDDIYMIDQHAAHERYLYEMIKENYKNNLHSNSQLTLIPEVINLTHKEYEFVKDNIRLFTMAGFDVEFFGDTSVKLNGIPDIEYKSKTNSKDMFMDILDEMITNTRSPIKDIEERFIATVACKAAVKAGMDLTKEEVDVLIQNLFTLQNPYTCPHGRPTTIKLNKDEFKKL